MKPDLHWIRTPGDAFDVMHAACGTRPASCFTTDVTLIECERCKQMVDADKRAAEEDVTQKIEVLPCE